MRWPAYLLTMTVTATIGTVLAGGYYFLTAEYFGQGLPWNGSFRAVVKEALSSSIPITWVIGSLVTAFGTISHRLQAAELALRTQQLERERAEKLAAEAQLASLASRVQPHFLFNTLNAISALVREEPTRAEAMIERLATLLRSSLDSAQTVPLSRELKLVTDYLDIQQERLGARLRYQVESTPDTDAAVPPFSIQTVVENCLKHVAGRRSEGVSVTVRATQTASELLIDVVDDGPGFSEDAVKAGSGLDNLQGRLRALFGDRAKLEFRRDASGMTVRLRVPLS